LKEIAQRVKELRKAAKLGQDEMARLLGIKRPAYSKIERGINNILTEHVIKIARHFNVTTDWLLFGKEDSPGTEKDPFDYSKFGKYKSTAKLMFTEMIEDEQFMHAMFKNFFHEKLMKKKTVQIKNMINNGDG
jgi:transcriptional regulator with XRE-family HTH domain